MTLKILMTWLWLQNFFYMLGSRIGFFNGDLERIVEDFQALRPAYMASVPRILNRVYEQVLHFALSTLQLSISRSLLTYEMSIFRSLWS